MAATRAAVVFLLTGIAGAADASGPTIFDFQIHPELDAGKCAELPATADLADENDFPRLVSRGWVALRHANFAEHRESYPCLQDVTVRFPSDEAFHSFVSEMTASPQYPFYSGADYGLQTAIFEHVARSADPVAYHRLLEKDTRNSASEMNAPLYSILRKNPNAFLLAFASLSAEQQQVAAAAQYDLNLGIEEQQFAAPLLLKLSPEAAASGRRFNELLKVEARLDTATIPEIAVSFTFPDGSTKSTTVTRTDVERLTGARPAYTLLPWVLAALEELDLAHTSDSDRDGARMTSIAGVTNGPQGAWRYAVNGVASPYRLDTQTIEGAQRVSFEFREPGT